MKLSRLAAVSTADAGARSSMHQAARIAELIGQLAGCELVAAVSYLAGRLPEGRIGVGYSALADVNTAPADNPTLDILDVHRTAQCLQHVSGSGARTKRTELLATLFGRATADEQALLYGLFGGGLHQGAKDGVLTDALALAFGASPEAVSRAVLVSDNLAEVASVLHTEGKEALGRFSLKVGTPLKPMLAKTAASVEDSMERHRQAYVEWKLNGTRIQLHRSGSGVSLFTRSLRDVTRQLPTLADMVERIGGGPFILDAEVMGIREDGTHEPLQMTRQRFGNRTPTDSLSLFVFDALALEGSSLLDEPLTERVQHMERLIADDLRVARILTDSTETAQTFFAEARANGHEGVVVKDPTAPYAAGQRRSAWTKVKAATTLDLVVLAADWGSGKRENYLSNLHLGARNGGQFVAVGKASEGAKDSTLGWQTTRLLQLETHRDGSTIYLRPQAVLQVAFSGVQRSRRYPGGVALRLARIESYRDDKTVEQADTLETVRSYLRQ